MEESVVKKELSFHTVFSEGLVLPNHSPAQLLRKVKVCQEASTAARQLDPEDEPVTEAEPPPDPEPRPELEFDRVVLFLPPR